MYQQYALKILTNIKYLKSVINKNQVKVKNLKKKQELFLSFFINLALYK